MGQQKPPNAPSPSAEYSKGIQIYLKYLPELLQQEQANRALYDPQRVAEQQSLQAQFGPTQYRQQLSALKQLDPTGYNLRQQLGGRIAGDLNRGYTQDPQVLRQEQQAVRAGQSARGNIVGNAAGTAEALYQGQRAQQLYQNRLAEAGGFLGLQTPEQQIAGIQGVQPDRANAYVNPNAGYQGQQFGLQNYQNQLAQYAAGGGGNNPWAGALAGAASGALSGSMINFPYGTAVGAIGGGLAGYFSDPKTKTDVRKVGNIGLYHYKSKLDGHKYVGPMAPEIKSLIPSAVKKVGGLQMVKTQKVGLMPMRT
jgi:hypothetical protein